MGRIRKTRLMVAHHDTCLILDMQISIICHYSLVVDVSTICFIWRDWRLCSFSTSYLIFPLRQREKRGSESRKMERVCGVLSEMVKSRGMEGGKWVYVCVCMAWLRERKGHGGSKVGLIEQVVVCSPPIIGNFCTHYKKHKHPNGIRLCCGGGPDWKLRN